MHHEAMLEIDRRGKAEHERLLMQAMVDACENGIMVWHLGGDTEEPVIWNPAACSLLFGREEEGLSTLKDCSKLLNLDLDALAREVNRTGRQVKVLVVREGSPERQLLEVSITSLDVEHVGFQILPK
jgi:hypothetical protein